MGKKIYSFGECLVRIDVTHDQKVSLFATGTALNFASNISRLEENEPFLITALSIYKDSEMFTKFCTSKKVTLQAPLFDAPVGSYSLFRTPSQYGWEVVYNRSQTVWTKWMENFDAEKMISQVQSESHLHFDGITICSSATGQKNLLEVISSAKKKNCSISFDFNFRSLLGEFDKFADCYEKVIDSVDVLFISWTDLLRFVKKTNNDERRKPIIEFHKKHPQLKLVCVSEKKADKNLLIYKAYCSDGKTWNEASAEPFQPNELLGMGDALAAAVINDYVSKNKIDLQKSLQWAALKSLYLGDAEGQTKKEWAAVLAGKGVTR